MHVWICSHNHTVLWKNYVVQDVRVALFHRLYKDRISPWGQKKDAHEGSLVWKRLEKSFRVYMQSTRIIHGKLYVVRWPQDLQSVAYITNGCHTCTEPHRAEHKCFPFTVLLQRIPHAHWKGKSTHTTKHGLLRTETECSFHLCMQLMHTHTHTRHTALCVL